MANQHPFAKKVHLLPILAHSALLLRILVLVGLVLALVQGASAPQFAVAVAQPYLPTFSKFFLPDTIGPGSTTLLTFIINNSGGSEPVDNLAFTDNLPAEIKIATPANATSTCGGILSAPDGGGAISLTGLANAGVGAGEICVITVNVTSSDLGEHSNTSGDLTSSGRQQRRRRGRPACRQLSAGVQQELLA